eukprot:364264-Chlamydomonas_euryale.AAC.6
MPSRLSRIDAPRRSSAGCSCAAVSTSSTDSSPRGPSDSSSGRRAPAGARNTALRGNAAAAAAASGPGGPPPGPGAVLPSLGTLAPLPWGPPTKRMPWLQPCWMMERQSRPYADGCVSVKPHHAPHALRRVAVPCAATAAAAAAVTAATAAFAVALAICSATICSVYGAARAAAAGAQPACQSNAMLERRHSKSTHAPTLDPHRCMCEYTHRLMYVGHVDHAFSSAHMYARTYACMRAYTHRRTHACTHARTHA